MNNFISLLFSGQKLLLKNTKSLDFKAFSTKRNYELIYGIDESSFNTFVFIRNAKSRFVLKDLEFLNELSEKIASKLGIVVKKRVLFYNSPICSKVLKHEEFKKIWKFYDFM